MEPVKLVSNMPTEPVNFQKIPRMADTEPRNMQMALAESMHSCVDHQLSNFNDQLV